MKTDDIIVYSAKPERLYFKIYYDFVYNELLDGDEKCVFMILKSFLDFSMDKNGTEGKVYPTIQTICKITKWGNQKVIKVINSLVEKGFVEKIQRGLNKPNVYILSDYAEIWAAKSIEEVKEIVENDGKKPMTAEEHIAELKKLGYDVEIKKVETMPEKAVSDTTTTPIGTISDTATKEKEIIHEKVTTVKKSVSEENIEIKKESISAPNKVTDIDTNNKLKTNYTTQTAESQVQPSERYTLDQIHQHFEYDILIQDPHYNQDDIDSVMSILYTALNTTKPAIRICGEDKPSMVVIGKLMKLNMLDIQYSIDKFNQQTDRIKNPTAYMLTILYNAKEQSNLDFANMVHHDMYGMPEQSPETINTEPVVAGNSSSQQGSYNQNRPKNQFDQFMQREVSQEELDELERKLLQH